MKSVAIFFLRRVQDICLECLPLRDASTLHSTSFETPFSWNEKGYALLYSFVDLAYQKTMIK